MMPIPYLLPDETLYSAVARYLDRFGFSNYRGKYWSPFKHLLGSHAPGCVGEFASWIRSNGDPDVDENDLLQNHTLHPIVALLATDRDGQCHRDLLVIGTSFRGMSRQLYSGVLQLCRACVEDDRRQFGETYWHRLHQVSGVRVCANHRIALTSTGFPSHHTLAYVTAEHALREGRLTTLTPLGSMDAVYASDLAWLLSHPDARLPGGPGRRYQDLLQDRGFVKGIKAVRDASLRAAIADSQLEPYVDPTWPHDWLSMTRRARRPWPLCHWVLMRFLGDDVSRFFDPNYTPHTVFGSGPWRCRNPAAEHCGQPVITDICVVRRHGRKEHATFSCSCGYVYGQTMDWEGRMGQVHVLAFGSEYDAVFADLWVTGVKLARMRRLLGASNPALSAHALRLGLPPRSVSRVSPAALERFKAMWVAGDPIEVIMTDLGVSRETIDGMLWVLGFSPSRAQVRSRWQTYTREELRTKWCALRATNEGRPYQQWDAEYRSLTGWLQGHDRSWWLANRGPRGACRSRVDWEARDAHYAALASDIARHIRGRGGRPVRVTSGGILRRLNGGPPVAHGLDQGKLPKLRAAVLAISEPVDAFHSRLADWYLERLTQRGLTPTHANLRAVAGVTVQNHIVKRVKDQWAQQNAGILA